MEGSDNTVYGWVDPIYTRSVSPALPVRSVLGSPWIASSANPRTKCAPRGPGRRESMFSFHRHPCGGFRLVITIGGLTVVIDWS